MRTTKEERKLLWNQLAAMFRTWEKMSDEEVFQEAKKCCENIVGGSRTEHLKLLVLAHVEKMTD